MNLFWMPDVDFTSGWTWVSMSAGSLSAMAGWWLVGWLATRRRQIAAETEASLDRIEKRLPGLQEQAEAISVELADPRDTYEAMLHRNYHIRRHFGPVPGCQFCPQKAAS